MPEKLKALIESLNHRDAGQLWIWLDSTSDAIEQMKEMVEETHPVLKQELDSLNEL